MNEYIYGVRKYLKPPCKDCTERHLHCHSECEAYIAFNKEREQIREERKKVVEKATQLKRKKA